jgi:hypothetical protein
LYRIGLTLNPRNIRSVFPEDTVITGNHGENFGKEREDSGKIQNFLFMMTVFFQNNDSSFFRKEIEKPTSWGIYFCFFTVTIFPAEVFVMVP